MDVRKLVRKTEHFSGADLAHLCDSAAQLALEDSVRSGNARPIRMADFDRALRDVKPSTTAWLEDARNVVMFSNSGGRFDELLAYLKQRRMA
jgi:SpoVK/Ycf46/Vps4 family AAA+-type ATPase